MKNFLVYLAAGVLSGLVFAGCAEDDCGCGEAGSEPRVVSYYPGNGDIDVPSDTVLTVVFDREMDPATINAGTFTLEGPRGAVNAIVTFDSATATLTPSAPLAGHSSHTARLDRGVSDLLGNEMGVPFAWSFTTGTTDLIIQPVFEYTVRDEDGNGSPDTLVGGGPPGRLLLTGESGLMEDRAIVQFPMSAIAGDSVLAAVGMVNILSSTSPATPVRFEVWGFTGDGSAALPDWSSGSLVHSINDIQVQAGQTFAIPMTGTINAALNGGDTHAGFRIVVIGATHVEITTTAGTQNNRPRIVVQY
jgi:hypothetical protein